jgi:hypothetical protein
MLIVIVSLSVCLSTGHSLENKRRLVKKRNTLYSSPSKKKINVLLIDLALYMPIRARMIIRKRRNKRGHIYAYITSTIRLFVRSNGLNKKKKALTFR